MPRTYVRRRLIALTLGLGLLGMLTGSISHALAGQGSTRAVAAKTYVVQEGDTLWSIASQQTRGVDPRAMVGAISRVNHVSAGALMPGQSLTIPAIP